jgi:2-polyprenyl-3-methyl-5-hydroxy-6-metoxy-1,4-benzoquinol methylase
MRELQESAHSVGHDYRAGSPHLLHWRLNRRLLNELREVLESLRKRGLPWSVLDVGAGHGSFTEPLLAYGCTVTATEMSAPSLAGLRERYDSNDRFSVLLDEDGSLKSVGENKFSLVLFASVLHHIPDYEAALTAAASRLHAGGALVSFQDPLWYPTLKATHRRLSQATYLSWRLGQGSYLQGLMTRLRRVRGIYDPRNLSDMVEYHVVRQGVDQRRVSHVLSPLFRRVDTFTYWSTQSSLGQRLGEAVKAENTFGVVADDRL